jgi:putative aldouronate transport system permease protein
MKLTAGEKIFNAFNHLFISLISFSCLYPFLYIIAVSLSSSRAISSGEVFLWPVDFNLEAYKQLVRDGQIFIAMRNTVLLTIFGTMLNMVATILCSYALSKKRMRCRGLFTFLIAFTMFFGGGMIPNFILIRNLGLMDTYWALWLPGLISTYNMIVLRTFFQGIPDSLEEAAQIDGAGDPYILFRIVLPLSGPALATVTLFHAVGWWNTYFSAVLYITSTIKYPLMVKLKVLLDTAQYMMEQVLRGGIIDETLIVVIPESFKAASILVSVLPIICVYPFLQKHFVKGVLIGSIKG